MIFRRDGSLCKHWPVLLCEFGCEPHWQKRACVFVNVYSQRWEKVSELYTRSQLTNTENRIGRNRNSIVHQNGTKLLADLTQPNR